MKLNNFGFFKKVFCSFGAFFLLVSCSFNKNNNKRDLMVPTNKQEVNEIWNGQIDEQWFDSQKDEFHISTSQEFAGLSNLVNSGYTSFVDKKIFIDNDLFFNDTSAYDDWAEVPPTNVWSPIGTSNTPFKGVIDFQGHFVYGMYINNQLLNAKYEDVGLFGCIELKSPESPLYVKNLQLTKSMIVVESDDSAAKNVGSVVGKIVNGGTFGKLNGLCNVFSDCKIISKKPTLDYVGGLSGYTQANIFNSVYTGQMYLENIEGKVGGISAGGAIPTFVINSYSIVDLKEAKVKTIQSGVISYHGIPISCFYLKNTEKNGGFYAFGYARRIETNNNYLAYGNGTFAGNDSEIHITPSTEVRWNESSGVCGDNRIDFEVEHSSLLDALNSFSFEKVFTSKQSDNDLLSKWKVDPLKNNGYPILKYDGE